MMNETVYDALNESEGIAMKNRMMRDIEDIMKEFELIYQCDEQDGNIVAGFEDSMLAYEVNEDLVECIVVYRERVPEETRGKVLEYINSANVVGKEGHFEMDGEGHPRFRLVRRALDGQPIEKEHLRGMMGLVINAERALMSGVYRVASGEAEPKEAIAAALFKMLHGKAA